MISLLHLALGYSANEGSSGLNVAIPSFAQSMTSMASLLLLHFISSLSSAISQFNPLKLGLPQYTLNTRVRRAFNLPQPILIIKHRKHPRLLHVGKLEILGTDRLDPKRRPGLLSHEKDQHLPARLQRMLPRGLRGSAPVRGDVDRDDGVEDAFEEDGCGGRLVDEEEAILWSEGAEAGDV